MRAFHSNWTAPYYAKHDSTEPYKVEDFELLTTILSALKWQEYNGSIEMIADSKAAEYYRKLGLESLWDLGIDDTLEVDMKSHIKSTTFWAAGKLYALAKQTEPCVMLDTDFIIWKDLNLEMAKHDATVIHREAIMKDVYPSAKHFSMASSYQYPKQWSWDELPCNTAFTCFNNMAFKNYYVQEAIKFMEAAKGEDPLIYMVFAEQRLLAMCAKEKHIDLYAFSDVDALFNSHQTTFTHIWGYKRYLRQDSKARTTFCKRCVGRIKKDYPEFYPRLSQIGSLKQYL